MFIDAPSAKRHKRMMRTRLLLALPFAVSGCVVGSIASTAVDIVSLPVKAVSAGVDAATTSQSEADEKRGREQRKAEEQAGREARELQRRCREGRQTTTDRCP